MSELVKKLLHWHKERYAIDKECGGELHETTALLKEAADRIEQLEQQRDELLAALKRAERETGFMNCQEISLVIAEVEGEK